MGLGAQNWRVDLVFCLLPEQVAEDQWRRLIQDAVLKPEVRRYMFYNSRAFQIAIAVVRTVGSLACHRHALTEMHQDVYLGFLWPGRERGLSGEEILVFTHPSGFLWKSQFTEFL